MIELTHISKDFGTGQKQIHAVCDVSLSIDKGEIFGIIGTINAEQGMSVLLVEHDKGFVMDLADRVMVLSARPTKIQATFEVKLPHPRRLTSPEVQQLRTAILRELGVEHDVEQTDREVAHG